MSERDPQSIVLSRQSILLVTAVSVGLLTLCYVLGVQVGKQSAALRNSTTRGAGEDLQELPASIEEQLKALQGKEMVKTEKITPKTEAPESGKQEPPAKPAEVKAAEVKAAEVKKGEPKWTLQLVSTTDAAEAERIVAKAKAAGFATTTLKDKGAFKVRLAKAGPRAEIDAAEIKLKGKGFKTYPMKVE
jgi:cell division septation protein DedD